MPLPYGGDPDTFAHVGRGRLFGGPRRRWERYAVVVAIVMLVGLLVFILWPTG